jgi:prepilin-type N-terminal cleavage/methylation domain-containing protein
MTKAITKKNKGFTLIELLVVIAIIGVISSVVLASVKVARSKARNAAMNSLVRQYLNAFEFAYDAQGTYPFTNDGNSACLGINNLNNECQGTPQNLFLNTTLNNYIKGPPAGSSLVVSGFDYGGIYYDCIGTIVGPTCSQIQLEWVLEGNGGANYCGIGTPSISGAYTNCVYRSQ